MEIRIEKKTALMVLTAIKPIAQAIVELADSLADENPTLVVASASTADTATKAEEKKESSAPKKAYTLTEVRAFLTQKVRTGYGDQVKTLVKKYGDGTLSSVKSENYKDLLSDAMFTCREPITKDEVKARIKELRENGFEKELPALFEHCGATSLADLAPEHFASFMRDAWRLDHE